MEERLWNIITVPALVIVLVTGVYLLWLFDWLFLTQGWMHIKLLGLVFLLIYHYWSWRTLKELQRGETRYSSVKLRMANEVATLLLFRSTQGLVPTILVGYPTELCRHGSSDYGRSENCEQKKIRLISKANRQ